MTGVRTFDPKKVTVMYGGRVVTGFAEGSMVKCEKNADNNTPHVGVMGEVSRAISGDNTGKITMSLAGTSPWIGIFSRLAAANELDPCNIIDMNDHGVNVGGSECWIVKAPDVNIGKDIEEQDVEIYVADYTIG